MFRALSRMRERGRDTDDIFLRCEITGGSTGNQNYLSPKAGYLRYIQIFIPHDL